MGFGWFRRSWLAISEAAVKEFEISYQIMGT